MPNRRARRGPLARRMVTMVIPIEISGPFAIFVLLTFPNTYVSRMIGRFVASDSATLAELIYSRNKSSPFVYLDSDSPVA